MKPKLSLKKLSKRDMQTLERLHRKWQRRMAPRREAIRQTGLITGDDLKIIVR